jgi:hypothetical protein
MTGVPPSRIYGNPVHTHNVVAGELSEGFFCRDEVGYSEIRGDLVLVGVAP